MVYAENFDQFDPRIREKMKEIHRKMWREAVLSNKKLNLSNVT